MQLFHNTRLFRPPMKFGAAKPSPFRFNPHDQTTASGRKTPGSNSRNRKSQKIGSRAVREFDKRPLPWRGGWLRGFWKVTGIQGHRVRSLHPVEQGCNPLLAEAVLDACTDFFEGLGALAHQLE